VVNGRANGAAGGAVSGSVIVGIAVVIMLAVGLSVFAYLRQVPRPIAIAEIHANLRKYDGTSVTVRGQVSQTMNVAGVKWFSLRDDTASIIVVTQRGLPVKDQLLTTTGIVREVFNFAGLNGTVLLEPAPPD
jgi:hypothetical protein